MNEKTIQAFYEYLVNESFELIESSDFDYKHARNLYKKFKSHVKMIDVLIKELSTSLEIVNFNNNQELETEIERKLQYYLDLKEKNQQLLKYEISNKQGYYMFVKDVTIILGV